MINYSVQPSSLSNSSSDVLGRYQVSYGEAVVNFSLGEFPLSEVSQSLADGRPVNFLFEGSTLFQIIPSISGSTLFSAPTTPLASQVNLGFRPTPAFLAAVREKTTFSKVETSARIPVVLVVNEQYLDEKAVNTISVNGSHSDYIEIVGKNLRPMGDNITISVNDGTDTVALVNSKAQVINWTNSRIQFTTKAGISTPAATGLLEIDVDGRTTTFQVAILDRT